MFSVCLFTGGGSPVPVIPDFATDVRSDGDACTSRFCHQMSGLRWGCLYFQILSPDVTSDGGRACRSKFGHQMSGLMGGHACSSRICHQMSGLIG